MRSTFLDLLIQDFLTKKLEALLLDQRNLKLEILV